MRHMIAYDAMESWRITAQWLGATAEAIGAYPATGLVSHPGFRLMGAWGDVMERSFGRMVTKPGWGIGAILGEDGREHLVSVERVLRRPFCDLVRFRANGRKEKPRRILLVAPMSGHYATLLRPTVASLLPDAEVWITDWQNARDIPVSAGKFDVEDYTIYLAEFIRTLGPDINVVAVCQPAPLALAATALLAAEAPEAQPRTLTLIGGPIDPEAAPTEITDFGRSLTMGQLYELVIQRIGFKYGGVGRMVYPGLLQLTSFMSMNAETHMRAFAEQVLSVAKGDASDNDRHNRFYDEYLAVMDMPAEFYLSTVERIFKRREIALNAFTVSGHPIDIGAIRDVAVHVVEGEEDDISAPGQCSAALPLLTGLPDHMKTSHLEPGAGHYGIFAGRSWRQNIRPHVLKFIDENGGARASSPRAESVPDQSRSTPAALRDRQVPV